MKALNVVAAFLGGLALGAAAGVLFAPEKGEDTRSKIAELLRKKGIRLNREEMDDLVDQIASEVKDAETNEKVCLSSSKNQCLCLLMIKASTI